jgi:hypothetical protein
MIDEGWISRGSLLGFFLISFGLFSWEHKRRFFFDAGLCRVFIVYIQLESVAALIIPIHLVGCENSSTLQFPAGFGISSSLSFLVATNVNHSREQQMQSGILHPIIPQEFASKTFLSNQLSI